MRALTTDLWRATHQSRKVSGRKEAQIDGLRQRNVVLWDGGRVGKSSVVTTVIRLRAIVSVIHGIIPSSALLARLALFAVLVAMPTVRTALARTTWLGSTRGLPSTCGLLGRLRVHLSGLCGRGGGFGGSSCGLRGGNCRRSGRGVGTGLI